MKETSTSDSESDPGQKDSGRSKVLCERWLPILLSVLALVWLNLVLYGWLSPGGGS